MNLIVFFNKVYYFFINACIKSCEILILIKFKRTYDVFESTDLVRGYIILQSASFENEF